LLGFNGSRIAVKGGWVEAIAGFAH